MPPPILGRMNGTRNRGPVPEANRISSLDTIRGVAVLGILPMNALAFGLSKAGYVNVSADGIGQPLDSLLGVLTMVFIDQKMMALFSLLFGVGVVIFAERAAAKGRRVVWLSLWRFALLAAVGLVHAAMWFGDILVVYAACAPVVLLLRRLPAGVLAAAGAVLALAGTAVAPLVQSAANASEAGLGKYWFADGGSMPPAVEAWFGLGAVGRALGFMLIGVALYRLGIVQGQRDRAFYQRLALGGIVAGTAITAVAPAQHIANGWSPEHAISGTIPIGLGLIPMALGYMALIIMWSRSGRGPLRPFRNAGRMALTNYLAQTVLGVTTLGWLLADVGLTRTVIAAWVLGVWALQLWWSTWWLERFRFGPFEWAWRCATYWSRQPLRRDRVT